MWPVKPSGGLSVARPMRATTLVRVGANVIVVGVGEGGFTKLGEMAAADLPTEAPPPGPFADVLAKVLRK